MKKIHEKIINFFESKILVGILYGIGIVIVLALVFLAGISTGFHKASFGRNWGENYERNFGPRNGMRPDFSGMKDFPNAHGAIGKIIKIELPTIIVQDKDQTEKIIFTKEDTKIQKKRDTVKLTDLAMNDFIVVIGSPNSQGQIEAKFIRVMPAPELLNNGNIQNEKPLL